MSYDPPPESGDGDATKKAQIVTRTGGPTTVGTIGDHGLHVVYKVNGKEWDCKYNLMLGPDGAADTTKIKEERSGDENPITLSRTN